MVTPAEYIENEFKKIGKADVFTPELAEQIKNKVPYIQHPDKVVDRDGNSATTTFHIKKSADSDNYFLNKFDMHVQRAGKKENVQETFYINDAKRNANNPKLDKAKFFTTFTFKKAFNYLIGRPVRNLYYNLHNQSHRAWDQIDMKAPLGKGRFERRTYNDKYGYALEKVMSNYSIKPTFKDSLVQSLERGNLQSAKFVGNDGRETELYISPNIKLGSLNVFKYDNQSNTKKIVQLDELEKNGWITKEFAQTLREKIKELTKQNVQTNKQTPVEFAAAIKSQKPPKQLKEGEKAAKSNKKAEKVDAAEKKTRKHKISHQ